MKQRILLIITGSIAAYKIIDLHRLLIDASFIVDIILTESAKHFVNEVNFSVFSNGIIYKDNIFQKEESILHIDLAKNSDLIIIAPATADFLARMATGTADTLALATLLVSYDKKILIAPAMNPQMWSNPITENNITTLRNIGMNVLDPIYGKAACGAVGYGKYIGNDKIMEHVNHLMEEKNETNQSENSSNAHKYRVVLTLGGTQEYIDPVRFIGNLSSGKQGFMIAKSLINSKFNIGIIVGSIADERILDEINKDNKTKIKRAYNAKEFLNSSYELLPCDIYISCAAIGDFKIKDYSNQKIKKHDDTSINLELELTEDVVSNIAKMPYDKRPKIVIGFALEDKSDNVFEIAQKKFLKKRLDLLVLNYTNHLNKESNEFAFIDKSGIVDLGFISKEKLAMHLTDRIKRYLSEL